MRSYFLREFASYLVAGDRPVHQEGAMLSSNFKATFGMV